MSEDYSCAMDSQSKHVDGRDKQKSEEKVWKIAKNGKIEYQGCISGMHGAAFFWKFLGSGCPGVAISPGAGAGRASLQNMALL